MSNDPILLDAFALGGYRSFGEIQRFERFAKINLLIGQNNSGKSNVLKFIHEKLSTISGNNYTGPTNIIALGQLDRNILINEQFCIGFPVFLGSSSNDHKRNTVQDYYENINDIDRRGFLIKNIFNILTEKAKLDNTTDAWFYFSEQMILSKDNWDNAFNIINDNHLQRLWLSLGQRSGGSRKEHWYPETLNHLKPAIKKIHTKTIPAIRQVGKHRSTSDDFDGEGIIERLAKLQNPDVHSQKDKKKFKAINRFLQTVTDNTTAQIEIPHERDTILVHMDGKTLPLQSLGTGIHEVIIIAAAATILENHIICMEEPEIHLHPILQKKLVRYLTNNTSNQYFISTHSAALMDTPDAEIYHIRLQNGQSIVERVTSDRHRSAICEDLGYHPSDLLQANCVIWVEGPSDRIYLNYWLKSLASHYIEGIHYSIMFYAGRLASHLSGLDIDEKMVDDFISLRRLNRRGVILIDSDRRKKSDPINATKRRLEEEFNLGPGYAWITEGREIENYLPVEQIKSAITASIPSATSLSKFGKYDNVLSIRRQNGKKADALKPEVARYIVSHHQNPDLSQLDLREQLDQLIQFILESNPGLKITI